MQHIMTTNHVCGHFYITEGGNYQLIALGVLGNKDKPNMTHFIRWMHSGSVQFLAIFFDLFSLF